MSGSGIDSVTEEFRAHAAAFFEQRLSSGTARENFHEGAGGKFYTKYGIPPNYGPWPWKGTGNDADTANPGQTELFDAYLPQNIQRDINFGPLSNIPVWNPDPAGARLCRLALFWQAIQICQRR